MRRLFLVLTISLFCFSGAFAASYLPKPVSKPAVVKPSVHYSGNWAYFSAVTDARNELSRQFDVTSFAYPYTLRFIFPDSVLFAENSHVLINTQPLAVVTQMLSQLPGVQVSVVGYSNNIDGPKLAKKESMLKAEQVAGFFWKHHIPGVTQKSDFYGAGASKPLLSNQSLVGLRANQRLEIFVHFPH